MFIYKATNKINKKVYIGQTTQTLEERINQHNSHAYGHQYNYHFHNAIRKYGAENFEYEIIEDNIKDIETLNKREKYWIKYYNSYYNGYNSTLGGEGSLKRDDELIIKLFNEGKNTQEICEITGYNRATIYKSYKINNLIEENNKRKSEKIKIRCSRPVEQYDLKGNFIRLWSSVSECGKFFGQESFISAICRQEESTLSAYGFLFKYADDPQDIQNWVNRLVYKKNSGKAKKRIGQYDLNWKLISIFESGADAAKALGKNDKSNICAAARKEKKAYGFYWKYE